MLRGLLLKDRVLRGALAGIIGCLWLFAWNQASHSLLHFVKTLWTDALSQLVMGHQVKSTMNFIVAVVLLFMWNGFLGGIYTRIIIPERDGSYIGRAVLFGLIAWFFIYTFGTFYKIPTLDKGVWQTAISNWVAVIGWGIILGWLTRRWDDLEAEEKNAIK